MNARAEMPDGNTAALDHYLRDLDAEFHHRERIEDMCPDQDLRIEIADSVFEDDPHDFIPYCCDGNRGEGERARTAAGSAVGV